MPNLHTRNLALDFCLRVGELLLSSGAGAADVQRSMRELAEALGLRNVGVDITFTSLSLSSQQAAESRPMVQMRQVEHREIDYEDLTSVDHLVREILEGKIELLDARAKLTYIEQRPNTRKWWVSAIFYGVMAGGFALQLGGAWVVIASAAVVAFLVQSMQRWFTYEMRLPFFYQQIAGGALAALVAVGLSYAPIAVNASVVVTANIILLLSGIGFMSALQDALTGFYVTASARLLEVFLATAGIIAGISVGLAIAGALDLKIATLDPGQVTWQTTAVNVAGAMIAAGAFVVAAYGPKRAIVPVSMVAGAAMLVFAPLVNSGAERPWAAAVAAVLIGLVAYAVAGRFKVPALLIVIPAVAPMLPGLSIFRGLALLSDEAARPVQGILSLATAATIAIALAAGVLLGEYIAQPVKRQTGRLSRTTGPRLVGAIRERATRPAAPTFPPYR